jgi:hypothetical protein
MPDALYYHDQAELYFRMAAVCSNPELAAQYAAQGRMYLNLGTQTKDSPRDDFNRLLDEFNFRQIREGFSAAK